MEDWTVGLGQRARKIYGLGVPILSFFAPLTIILFSYTFIIYVLHKRQKNRFENEFADVVWLL